MLAAMVDSGGVKAQTERTSWQGSGCTLVFRYPLVMSKSLLKMAIEIVDLHMKNGDYP
jgi:hypothetical protein